MRLGCAALLPLAAAILPTGLTDRQYVVDIDFDAPPRELEDGDEAVQMAGTAFACASPEKDLANLTEHKLSLRLAGIKAITTLYGSCIFYRTKTMYWTFVVCPGQSVQQTHDSTAISLGTYDGNDRMLDDEHGTLVQSYTDGDDGRSAEVHYKCGRVGYGDFPVVAEEPAPLHYRVTVTGPFFCRSLSAAPAPQNAKPSESPPLPPLASLLDGLNSTCLNFTQGYWTYEYCHPWRAWQYHRNPDKSVGMQFELGRAREGVQDPPMSLAVRERIARETLVLEAPAGHHRRLKVHLTEGGQKCDETKSRRTSTVLFECPGWSTASSDTVAKLVGVVETSTCEYVFLVETVLACPHPLLLPKRPRAVHQAIKCTRRLEAAPSR